MTVYLIENLNDGKKYVGKTTQTSKARWREHRTESRIGRKDTPLLRAIRKDGPAAFRVSDLAQRDSQDKLAAAERRWIQELETDNPAKGYNVQYGGGCTRKPKRIHPASLTEEHREKIRQSLKAYHAERKLCSHAPTYQTATPQTSITSPSTA